MISCIIVEDEPLAIDLLKDFIGKVDDLQLVASCLSAREAESILSKNRVDLIFLDIQMPGKSGIEFLKQLKHPPKVVFTTAYPNYAVKGFELEAVDYLLKPFAFKRFQKAVDKVRKQLSLERKDQAGDAVIYVKSGYETVKINTDDIQYVEGLKDYVKINTSSGEPVLVLMSMKRMEDKLPDHKFLRIHRSYIIALDKITRLQSDQVWVEDKALPLGPTYKKSAVAYIRKHIGEEG